MSFKEPDCSLLPLHKPASRHIHTQHTQLLHTLIHTQPPGGHHTHTHITHSHTHTTLSPSHTHILTHIHTQHPLIHTQPSLLPSSLPPIPYITLSLSLSLSRHTIMDLSTLKSFKSHAFNLFRALSLIFSPIMPPFRSHPEQPHITHPLLCHPSYITSHTRHIPIHSSLLYSTADEGHCDLDEIFIFVLFHLYMS